MAPPHGDLKNNHGQTPMRPDRPPPLYPTLPEQFYKYHHPFVGSMPPHHPPPPQPPQPYQHYRHQTQPNSNENRMRHFSEDKSLFPPNSHQETTPTTQGHQYKRPNYPSSNNNQNDVDDVRDVLMPEMT